MRLIRDINTVGKRERMAAGIASTVIGAGVIMLSDWSMGDTLESSIINIAVTMVVGIAFLGGYRLIQKRRSKPVLNEGRLD